MAELELGRNLKADAIAEGNDVYFECRVHSNPPPHRFLWTHEVAIDCDGRYCLSNYLNFFLYYILTNLQKKEPIMSAICILVSVSHGNTSCEIASYLFWVNDIAQRI